MTVDVQARALSLVSLKQRNYEPRSAALPAPRLHYARAVDSSGADTVAAYWPMPNTWPSVRTTIKPSEIAGVAMITSFMSFFAI